MTPADGPPFDYEFAMVTGGFEPPRLADVAALRQALALAPLVVVAIRAARRAPSPRHPFSWEERAGMICRALLPDEAARVHAVPLRDHYGDRGRWTEELQDVAHAAAAQAGAGAPERIAWIDIDDHAAPGPGVGLPPGWTVVSRVDAGPPAGDLLTTLWGSSPGPEGARQALGALAPHVPPAVLSWLQEWVAQPLFQELREDWAMLQRYKTSWALAPFPPVFVTVDNVVQCGDHVLLVRRGGRPGKGLLALPGGFIEPMETTLQSALRELREETSLDLPDAVLHAALQGSAVFDHPLRSERGRTITHAFHFLLAAAALPAVRAGDDAQAVRWVPIDGLRALETTIFEDHVHILEHFLALR